MRKESWFCDLCGHEIPLEGSSPHTDEVTGVVTYQLFGPDTERGDYLENFFGIDRLKNRYFNGSFDLCAKCLILVLRDAGLKKKGK